jgi:hypothetical protein
VRVHIRSCCPFRTAPPHAALPTFGNIAPTACADTARPEAWLGADEEDRIMHRGGAVAVAAWVIVHGRPFPEGALNVLLSEAVSRAPTHA